MRISDWSSDVCSSDLFGDGFARRFDRQHRVMTLAVLRDLVGELLQAPGFGLVDRALIFADDVGDGFRQRIDLSLAQILTRDKDMLVKRSEEHTSELQSLMRITYAVFCLNKKTKRIQRINHT